MGERQRRNRRDRQRVELETLEMRTLFSTSYAVLVLDAPQGQPAVQVDPSFVPGPSTPGATLGSALDIQVRTVAGGIYFTVACSSTEFMTLAPTGTIDIYDDTQFFGTIELGGAMRSTVVLPAGPHTFYATYSGDGNFFLSQASVTANLLAPTSTPPENPANVKVFAKNDSGARVRPMRFLSRIDFFDQHDLTVAAIPPVPGAVPLASPGVSLLPGEPVPVPRFSKVTFSVKLPKAVK